MIADVLSPSVSASWMPQQLSATTHSHTHTPYREDPTDLTRLSSPSKNCTIRTNDCNDKLSQSVNQSNMYSPSKKDNTVPQSHHSISNSMQNKRDDSYERKIKKSDSVGDRIVVSFRGSILANLMTDLTMTQIPIPRLKYRKKFFVKMIQDLNLNDDGEESEGGKNMLYFTDKRSNEYSPNEEEELSNLKSPNLDNKLDVMEMKLNHVINKASYNTVLSSSGAPDDAMKDFTGCSSSLPSSDNFTQPSLVSLHTGNTSVTPSKICLIDKNKDNNISDAPITSIQNPLSIPRPSNSPVCFKADTTYTQIGHNSASKAPTSNTTQLPDSVVPPVDDEFSLKLHRSVSGKLNDFDSKSRLKEEKAIVNSTQLLNCCLSDSSSRPKGSSRRLTRGGFRSYFTAGNRDNGDGDDDGDNDGEGVGAMDPDCDSSRGSSYMDLEAQILQYNTSDKIGYDIDDCEKVTECRQKLLRKGNSNSSNTQGDEDDIGLERMEGKYTAIPLETDDDGISGADGKSSEKRIVESSWFTCLRSVLSSLPIFQHTLPRIHEGFWGAYSSVRTDVLRSIVRAFCYHKKEHKRICNIISHNSNYLTGMSLGMNNGHLKPQHPILSPLQVRNITNDLSKPLRVYFCGHSLGAALTVLAALDLSVNLNYILDAIETVYGDGEEDNSNEIKTKMNTKSSFNENPNQESSKNSVKKLFPVNNNLPENIGVSTPSSKVKKNVPQSTEMKNVPQSSEMNSVELTSFYTAKDNMGGIGMGVGQGAGQGNKDTSSTDKKNTGSPRAPKWESPTIAVYTYGGTVSDAHYCTLLYATARYFLMTYTYLSKTVLQSLTTYIMSCCILLIALYEITLECTSLTFNLHSVFSFFLSLFPSPSSYRITVTCHPLSLIRMASDLIIIAFYYVPPPFPSLPFPSLPFPSLPFPPFPPFPSLPFPSLPSFLPPFHPILATQNYSHSHSHI